MNDFVREMHTKSGLLPEIERSTVSVADTQQATMDYIKQYIPKPSSAPLCGNSIGTDRRFLSRYMNDLDEYLHYRSIDVSSLKELCRRWNPPVYRKRPGKAENHRALDDIRESIEELRFYPRTSSSSPTRPLEIPNRRHRVRPHPTLSTPVRLFRGARGGRRGGRLPSARERRGP